MDTIVIEKLKVETVIGVYDWEQSVRQTLLVDLALGCDIRKAAASDTLVDAIDYANISERVIAFASSHRFQLMETLAEQLAQLVFDEFNVRELKLSVYKPGAIAQAASAGVHIERIKR